MEPPPVALVRKHEQKNAPQQDIEELVRKQVATHVDLIRTTPPQNEPETHQQPQVAAAKQKKKKIQKPQKKKAAPVRSNQRAYKNQTVSHVWASPDSTSWQQQ